MSDLPPGCPLELVRSKKSILPKRRKILLDTRWPDWTSLWLPLAFLRRWTNIRLYFWSFKSRKIFGQRKWVADNFWKEDVLNHPVHPHSQDQPQSDRWYLPLKTIHFHTQKQKQPFSGTYQCSVLRRCDPVPKAKETLEDDPVAITKSLYMKVTINIDPGSQRQYKNWYFKPGVRFSWWPTRSGRRQKIWLHDRIENMFPTQVYEYPDYQPDLVVVISAFGVTFVILLVGDLKSNRIWKKDILRHQVSVTIERTASGGSSHQWKLCRFSKDVALLFGII